MSELYSRQETLSLNIPQKIILVGAGGIGFWAGILFAAEGVPEIDIWDGDALEESNRARLLYPPSAVNQNKAELLAEFIHNIRPECMVIPYAMQVNPITIGLIHNEAGNTILLDCTDQDRIQKMLYEHCKESSLPYLKLGYNGTSITITDKYSEWSTRPGESGYTVIPSWVVPAAIVAALGVFRISHSPGLDISGNISELVIANDPTRDRSYDNPFTPVPLPVTSYSITGRILYDETADRPFSLRPILPENLHESDEHQEEE